MPCGGIIFPREEIPYGDPLWGEILPSEDRCQSSDEVNPLILLAEYEGLPSEVIEALEKGILLKSKWIVSYTPLTSDHNLFVNYLKPVKEYNSLFLKLDQRVIKFTSTPL
jgi:hypothetical protein